MKDKKTLVKSRTFNDRLTKAIRGDLAPLKGRRGLICITGSNLNQKALEMHRAVITLLRAESPMAGAAGALIRPMFECHLRGFWWIKCALGEISDPDERHNMRNIEAFVSPPLEGSDQDPARVEGVEQRNMLSRKDWRNAWAWHTILAKLKKNDPDKGFMESYSVFLDLKLQGYDDAPTDYAVEDFLHDFVHGGHLQAQTGIKVVKGTPRAKGHYTETLQTSFLIMAEHIAWLSGTAIARAHTDPNAREKVARIGKSHLVS